MSRRPSSIVLLLVVLAGAAAAVWVISTRSRPALAVYDSMPAFPAPSGTLVADTSVSDTSAADSTPAGKLAAHSRDSAAHRLRSTPPPPRAGAPTTSDTATRPHRSDTYGGYSGYGSKERRGDPNAR